jgi:hypothetical protein
MKAMNKTENVRLLKVCSSDCEWRKQLGDVQKRIMLQRIVEPVAEMCISTIITQHQKMAREFGRHE